MASRPEAREFLASFKLAIEFDRWGFKARYRTEQDLISLSLTRRQAADIICCLTPDNYCRGPEPDDTDSAKDVWVFGYDHEGTEVYIKLRLNPTPRNQMPRGTVWSFHPAEHPMRYPLRGGGA